MKSELHSLLQDRAKDYLLAKTYWVRALEMPVPTGIVDVWGLSRSKDYETMAIEVKVSKADFRSRSQKYKEGSTDLGHIANYCYILCPENLIQPEEVDPLWGLLWAGDRIINKKKAVFIEMSYRQKLAIMINFLSSGVNKPKL